MLANNNAKYLSVLTGSFLSLCKLNKINYYEKNGLYYPANS